MKTKHFLIANKFAVVIFIVSIFFSPINARFANADSWTGTDWANLGVNTTTSVSSVASLALNAISANWQTIVKNALDAAAYAAAQQLLTSLTDSTVNWIQGGFHGSPAFNVDANKTIADLKKSVVDQLVSQITGACDFTATFKLETQQAMQLSNANESPLKTAIACPFNATSIAFYNDFNSGKWESFATALGPGGNAYGVQVATANELASKQDVTVKTDEVKKAQSGGFTDIIDTGNCDYPADLFAEMVPEVGDCSQGTDQTICISPGFSQEDADAQNQAIWGDPAKVDALQKQYCKTTTPGKVIGDSLMKSLGVTQDRIGFSDNMNKIISAFLKAATQGAVHAVFH